MKSIRRQLIGGLLPAILVLAVASGAGLYLYVRHVLMSEFDAALNSRARAVAAAVRWEDEGPGPVSSPDVSSADFSRERHPAFFQVWSADGKSRLQSGSLKGANLPQVGMSGRRSSCWNLALPDGREGRAIEIKFVPAHDDEDETWRKTAETVGGKDMTLVLAQSREPLEEPLGVLLTSLLIATAAMAGGVVVVVALAVRRSLRPLARVADEAAARDSVLLGHRFPVDDVPAELAPICRRLNDLLERLDEAFQRERRFTSDVAHELRTPIAELKSLSEVALKWPADATSAAAGFQDALDIATQMERIVTTLLFLARGEGRSIAALQPVDIDEVLKEAWRSLEAPARARQLSVEFHVPPQTIVHSDRTLLLAIAANLLSNAVQYTTRGGKIRCDVTGEEETTRLVIGNDNESLAADDLPHLFEPFWRKDTSRSDSHHSGLGLSLVQAYAKHLGASVEASLIDSHWLEISLTIPALRESTVQDPTSKLPDGAGSLSKAPSTGSGQVSSTGESVPARS